MCECEREAQTDETDLSMCINVKSADKWLLSICESI